MRIRSERSPLPTIAAVNGAAVGAGMNLALGCDVRLAGRSARFDTRFLDLGIHPGGGHTWMLRRLVGPQAREDPGEIPPRRLAHFREALPRIGRAPPVVGGAGLGQPARRLVPIVAAL